MNLPQYLFLQSNLSGFHEKFGYSLIMKLSLSFFCIHIALVFLSTIVVLLIKMLTQVVFPAENFFTNFTLQVHFLCDMLEFSNYYNNTKLSTSFTKL